jgi:hypothetical protein
MKSIFGKVKNCSKCGKAFECWPEGNCWCNGYKISTDALNLLNENYYNCLCEGCLKDYQEEEIKI